MSLLATARKHGFNTRSSRRAGATWPTGCPRLFTTSFNTRSSRRAGATHDGKPIQAEWFVSTHAPAGGLERHNPSISNGTLSLFQHTLQPEGWSDAHHNDVKRAEAEFQHTLQPEGWSDDDGKPACAHSPGFNTRSSRRAGATSMAAMITDETVVSTHAPAGGLERQVDRHRRGRGVVVSTHAPAGGLERRG